MDEVGRHVTRCGGTATLRRRVALLQCVCGGCDFCLLENLRIVEVVELVGYPNDEGSHGIAEERRYEALPDVETDGDVRTPKHHRQRDKEHVRYDMVEAEANEREDWDPYGNDFADGVASGG